MKISEIITKKYKLRMPPTVYYELLADVVEVEEEQEPCEDAISRQTVLDGIEELKRSPWCTDKRNGYEYLIAEALDVVSDLCIKQAPSVNPQEPKTGRWKPNFRYGMYPSEEHFICSECNGQSMRQSKYCPECGSRMEGGD